MKFDRNIDVIVIGGSAGSIPVLNKILCKIPKGFCTPIIVCLHRMKSVPEGMKEVLSPHYKGFLVEPNDKDPILKGHAYIAPANYHLLVNKHDHSFCLSTEEMHNYSRPSIDLTFCSVADAFQKNTLGIILTGANKDGAHGINCVRRNGGITVAQNPSECIAPFMPQAAIDLNCIDHICSIDEITNIILSICK